LAKAIQTPILQWSDVKIAPYGVAYEDEMEFWRTNVVEDDYLGCWTNYAAFIPSHGPASGGMPEFLRMSEWLMCSAARLLNINFL